MSVDPSVDMRIHWLYFLPRVRLWKKEFPEYDIKLHLYCELTILEIWRVQSIPSLLLLPGPLWPGVVVPVMYWSIEQINMFKIIHIRWEYLMLCNCKLCIQNSFGSGRTRCWLHLCRGMRLPQRVSRIWHYMVLFTNPSARAGYDTRSIFKRSLTGLNSEFFLLLD